MGFRLGIVFFLLCSCIGADPLRVGVALGFPPYQYEVAGKPAGLDVDLTEAIFKEAGLSLVWVQRPWDDVVALLRLSDGLDLVAGMEMTGDRTALFRFTRTLYSRKNMLFVLASGPPVSNLRDLVGQAVTGDRDAYLEEVLAREGLKDSIRLVRTESKDAAFDLLAAGQVVAAIMPEAVGWDLAKQRGVRVRALDFGDPGSPVALAFSPATSVLLGRINRAIDQLEALGVLQAVIGRYRSLLK